MNVNCEDSQVLSFIVFDRKLLKFESKELASACFYSMFFNWSIQLAV